MLACYDISMFWKTESIDNVQVTATKALLGDLSKSDGYFWIIGVRVFVGKERAVESRPDHERVHRSLDIAVPVVAARSRRPVSLVRTYTTTSQTNTINKTSQLEKQRPTETQCMQSYAHETAWPTVLRGITSCQIDETTRLLVMYATMA